MANKMAARAPTATELELIAIWAEVLEQADVDVDANFVELGGDSIAATLCINLIKRRLDRDVSISEFLDVDMTLRRLAARIDAAAQSPPA